MLMGDGRLSTSGWKECERGRRMPTGHRSFYAYACICMDTHATPAGYKHLPIMLAFTAGLRPRVKGPLNSNGGVGIFIAKGAAASIYDAR